MRRALKWLLVILLLAQLPFLWELFQTERLNAYLQDWPEGTAEPPFQDLRGGLHIHSAAGGHSTGTYPEIIRIAKALKYRFAFITEHPREPLLYRRIEDPELVLIYGWEEELAEGGRVLSDDTKRYRFATHLEAEKVSPGLQGLEVYNLHENAEAADSWWNRISFLYHLPFFPRLFYFQLWELDRARLQLWDRRLSQAPLAGIAGNDAHQNVGLVLKTGAGRDLFSVWVDPYQDSLGFVTTHVVLSKQETVTADAILEALARGSAYICFERIADPTGFSFHARSASGLMPMGSRVGAVAELVVQSPVAVRFSILKDGREIQSLEGTRFALPAPQPGVYRVEVYPLHPPRLLRDKPWILSNPIVVTAG